MALEESVVELTQSITELANLFDASASTGYALTDQGHQRVVELQEQVCPCLTDRINLYELNPVYILSL